MCGIAGILYEGPVSPETEKQIEKMILVQAHRGPDGSGFFHAPGVSLGHSRLKIIDLSEGGHQPMADEEKKYWITYNGEIYNYVELKEELKGRGHDFGSSSDTEVLLHAYMEWGEDCLSRLRGMFAFAIWDCREEKLFGARDRFGIKPFHYLTDALGRLIFASEIKALLPFMPRRSVNKVLAGQYIAWSMVDHNPRETLIEGINCLEPGHYFVWRRGNLKISNYWSIEFSDELFTPEKDRKSLTEEFRSIFFQVIDQHLRSDVPVGTLLSGGLDSSSICCVVHDILHKRGSWRDGWQNTYSVCFDDPSIDERPYIELVVDKIGCKSHYIFPKGEDFIRDLDDFIWHQEAPVGGFGPFAHFCGARLAKNHQAKVLLNGQGPDEYLAGYRKFILVYLRQLMKSGHVFRATKEAVAFFGNREILKTSNFVTGRRYFMKNISELDILFAGRKMPERPPGMSISHTMGERIKSDLENFSIPCLLRYEDRNTMAFGIESRVPFMDHVLVEMAAKLPMDMRLSNGWTKRIMREALSDLLPREVKQRKTKLGFAVPDKHWMTNALQGWVKDTLHSPSNLHEIVEPGQVGAILDLWSQKMNSRALPHLLFRMSLYETWAKRFLESA